MLDAIVMRLQDSETAASGKFATPPLFMGAPARLRGHFGAVARDEAEIEELASHRVCGTLASKAIANVGHEVLALQGMMQFEDTCQSVHKMLGTFPQLASHECSTSLGKKLLAPSERMRVRPVDGPPSPCSNIMLRDHKRMAQMEWQRHAAATCHVEWLGREGDLDTTVPGMAFARHFWRCGAVDAPSRASALGPSRFQRMDGGGENSANRFSIMENGTTVVRQEGNDPYHNHALLTAADPLLVYADGHYFEVCVRSLFRRAGPPDRPRHNAPRTEGLILGVTTSPPAALDSSAPRVLHATRGTSWCISTSGTFRTGGAAEGAEPDGRPRRPATQESRADPRRLWHQPSTNAAKQDMLKCTWPPPSSSGNPARAIADEGGAQEAAVSEATLRPASAVGAAPATEVAAPQQRRRQAKLAWTVALDEMDVIGLLVTPFGGVVVTVNGEKRLMIPDAGVPCDVDLYPVIEVYNHVRCLQLVKRPIPPP